MDFFVTPNILHIRFASLRSASLLVYIFLFWGAGMSFIHLCQFSSKSSSKSVSEVRKTPFLTVYRVSCSSALCPKLLIIAHVTPWVHFRQNQSVNLRNTVSEVRNTLFFYDWSGILQLDVVFETSDIAHVTPRVHTFLGKKEFFKSVENLFLFGLTYKHTNIQSPTNTNIVIDKHLLTLIYSHLLHK